MENVSDRLVEPNEDDFSESVMPSEIEKESLLPGDFVKLILDPRERVLVKVEGISDRGYFGSLTERSIAYNDPKGTRIDFEPHHILEIERASKRIRTFSGLQSFTAKFPYFVKVDMGFRENGALYAKVDIPEKYGRIPFLNTIVVGDSIDQIAERVAEILIMTARYWRQGVLNNLSKAEDVLSLLSGTYDEEIVSLEKEGENG
jgi:hypothetical protein